MLLTSHHLPLLGLLLLSHLGRGQARVSPVKITATSYFNFAKATSRPDSILLEALNTTLVPYTVVLSPDSLPLYPGTSFPLRRVVPPGTAQILLARLRPIPGRRANYRYEYHSYLGNTISPPTGRGFVYQLPFEAGQQYRLMQGNNGALSHTSKYAVDFSMPEGTVVCAARAGIITHVKQDSNTGCPTSACANQANYVIVFHDDGSLAKYAHLRLHGSLVQVGQHVAAGQPLGYSGNTGWSSGPHLHFEVDVPGEPDPVSGPATFSVGGRPMAELVPGTHYGR